MSRLIDADELLKGYQDHEMISTHIIWNAPTVEAIPISYIKYIIEYCYGYWDAKIKNLEWLIDVWEHEWLIDVWEHDRMVKMKRRLKK